MFVCSFVQSFVLTHDAESREKDTTLNNRHHKLALRSLREKEDFSLSISIVVGIGPVHSLVYCVRTAAAAAAILCSI